MKKPILVPLILMISVFYLNAQNLPVLITGNYNQTPMISFINETEQKTRVKFFFDQKDIDPITVTATFNNTPLATCLEIILSNKPLKFTISANEVVIFPGFYLAELFPGSELQGQPVIANSPEKKMSKEKLLQLQYQIINIGVPGKNKGKTAILSGHLKTFESGEPIVGGNVYVSEIQKGATSDAKGFYTLTLPVGNQTLNISCIGMESYKRNINLYSDGKLDVEMEIKVNILEAAEVVGHGKGNLGQAIGMIKIDPLVIKSIPTLLGEADVMKSVLIMPGVQSVGEGTSGFNVRGGNTDQNLILIDQAPIYYPSHFFGNFSAINSEIVQDATLYKGSMPVKYGGRISSVFEINTIEGNHDNISGSAGISPISTRANIDGPLFSKKSTFLASFRSTYSNWLLSQFKVADLYKSKANFNDIQTKLNLFLNENNSLLVSFYNSNDKFQLHSDTAYSYGNTIGSLILKHKFNPRLKLNTALMASLFDYNISNQGSASESFILTHDLAQLLFNNDFEYLTNSKLKYLFGVNLNFYSVNPGERKALNNSNITPISSFNEHALEYGIYAGTEYSFSNKLKVEGGVRLSGLVSFNREREYIYALSMPYQIDNIIDTIGDKKNSVGKVYMNPEWRFSLNYSLNNSSSLKFSYNKTAQYIHMLSNTTAISPTDTWKLSDKLLLPETGNQFSAGYFRSFNRSRIDVSAEVYYKLVQNVKEYKAGADLLLNDHIETELVNGRAKAYGIELRIEKSGGRVYGQIDYTYSRTFVKSVTEFPEELINDGEYFPANYDKPHNLNLLANYKASRRFIISTSIVYSTGRPITYPVAQYKLGDQIFLQYSKYNQYRITDYFRTDLSVTVNGNLKKYQRFHSSFTFSAYNLTSRKNAYSIYFRSEGGKFDAYKLSIFGTVIPTLTYNLTF